MNKQFDILIIDDEQVITEAVTKICTMEGYKVDASLDAVNALSKLTKNSYRLIICDIMLPEIDGFQFLDEVNAKKMITPVVMTTGYSTVENAVKSLYKGAIDFIPKPFTSDELLSSIYRGLKYLEIQKKLLEYKNHKNDETIIYVPCPAKYFRLGYSSWIYSDSSGSAVIGVTDLFLKTIDLIDDIELQKVDEEIVQGNSCALIKMKDDMVHVLLSPVSGRIIERNNMLLEDKRIIEKDPYFSGWLYRVIPSDWEYEIKHLTPCSSDRL